MAKEFEIEIQGLKGLIHNFRRAPGETFERLQKTVKKAGLYIQGQMKKEAPIRKGTLRKTINLKTEALKAEIYPTMPYAIYVHEGTGIYGKFKRPIVPINKKALYWKGAAHPVKSVSGQRPNPFVKRTFEGTKDEVQKMFKETIQQILKFIANI